MDTETSGCGLVGTVVRGLQKLLVIIVIWFWLSVLLNKNQMNCSGFICSVIIIRWLVLVLVLLFKKLNQTSFCPFYWFCSGFAHQPWWLVHCFTLWISGTPFQMVYDWYIKSDTVSVVHHFRWHVIGTPF